MKWLALALVLCASSAHADLRIAFGNDTLSELFTPPYDDDGFTHDFDIAFTRPYREYIVGGRLYDRWITEVPRSGGRRRDLLELAATIERTWSIPVGTHGAGSLTGITRAGPSLTGDLGGRWMQDGFHRLCRCGASLDEGLQSRYEGGMGIGALVGSRVRASIGVPVGRDREDRRGELGWVEVYGVADGQAVLGAGVTFIDAVYGAYASVRIGSVRLAGHAEVGALRVHATDDRLALPGGYGSGWQTIGRTGMHVAWNRYRIEYQYRFNEGGSGEPIGIVAFTVKQAGTRF